MKLLGTCEKMCKSNSFVRNWGFEKDLNIY